jgi:hypothetical protein
MAKPGADESTECCDSKIVTDPGKHAPTPHESDECAICQHFLTCRDQAVFANNPLIVSLGIPTESVSVVRQMIRSDFQDSVHFLRGPPVA